MSAKFYTLLTNIGAAKLASAAALGVPLKITQMGVGDGGGVLPRPDAGQTALVAEKRRAALNMLYIDPQNNSQIIAEQVIPETDGGWWIREVGLYDETGALIAVGNCPESYKPQLAEGSGRTQTVRMVLITSSTDNITLKIDPAVVLATRQYVDDGDIEVKGYADKVMKAHLEADNPHTQYLLSANNLSDLKDSAKSRDSLGLKGAATKDVGTAAGQVIGVGGFGLGAEKIDACAIDFKTYIFRAGESLLIKMEGSKNIPTGLPAAKGQFIYAHCLGVRDTGYGCTVIFITHNNATISFLGTRLTNTSDEWQLMRVGNQEELTKYLALTGGDVSGRLGIAGTLEVGKSGKESVIQLGASKIFRDNASNALVISSESGAGSKTGIYLRPVASTNGTMELHGDSTGWNTSNLTAGTLSLSNALSVQCGGTGAKNARDACINLGLGEGSALPVGVPVPWPAATVPGGWLKCNGAAFDKAKYPGLAAAYPSGKLPDLRGEFIRGWDDGRKVDSGRSVLTAQGDAIRNITGSFINSSDGGVVAFIAAASGAFSSAGTTKNFLASGGTVGVGVRDSVLNFSAAGSGVPVASENRPRNIAFNYIVRAA
ncbi:phage tail protein [Erwiniaceae bacterium CAU 1747]